MITVYAYGCLTCGVNAKLVNKAKRYARDNGLAIQIHNSRENEADKLMHLTYLKGLLGRNPEIYEPIIIENETVTLLKDWNK